MSELKPSDILKEEIIIDFYKMGFEYTKDRHFQLITKISDIRNVANYIITGVIAFAGFILTSQSKEFLINPVQKILFFLILVLIIAVWLKMNWSIRVPVGFNPYNMVSAVREFNSKDYNQIKLKENIQSNDPVIGIYELVLKSATNEYIKAEKDLSGEFELLRRGLILLAILFFLICILFILFPNFNIILN